MTHHAPPWNTSSPIEYESVIPSTPADQLLRLWEAGGWDSRLPPRDAWQFALGDLPYPDADVLAMLPTFGPLDSWLEDPSLTDVHLNGPGRELITRRSGDAVELGMRETWHPDWYPWLVQQFKARGRGKASATQLYGTADSTRSGHRPCLIRYEIALPPLCPHGPVLTLRVLRPGRLSLERLTELDMLSAPAAELLACCMRAEIDLLIVGSAGAGKTTLAQALLATVADQRIICIEDVPELVIESPRTIHFELAATSDRNLSDLIRTALRMNPSRIVVGETRGAEAYAVLAAARNGYPVLTTLHGDSALHGLHNLAAMALEAAETHARLEIVHATLNARPMLLVAVSRQNGARQVDEIVEVQRQLSAAMPTIEPLYQRRAGELVPLTGVSPLLRSRLAAVGALPNETRFV